MTDDEEKRPRLQTLPEKPDRLGPTLLADLREQNLSHDFQRDLKETYEYFLDHASREELSDMGRFRRGLMAVWWMLRSMFLKLTPTRRILLLLAFFFTINGSATDDGQIFLGFIALLFILLLELKDKLLAQDELASGRDVQMSLMPDRNPTFTGWDIWLYSRPANDVGGDLVDYLPLDDDQLALALGDVAGKGLPAALMMAKLQATLRALGTSAEGLGKFGNDLNRILCRDGLPSRFASLLYLVLRPDDGTARVLNAGHFPPLIVRADGIDEMRRGAPALGLTSRSQYTEQTTHLDPGDLLVLYSDGVTEARDEQGAFYGEDRLDDLLADLHGHAADSVGRRLLTALHHFTGDARPSDDLSIIVVRRLTPTSA